MPGTDLRPSAAAAATKLAASSSEFDALPRKVAEETHSEIMVQFNTQKHVARRRAYEGIAQAGFREASAWQLPKTSSIYQADMFNLCKAPSESMDGKFDQSRFVKRRTHASVRRIGLLICAVRNCRDYGELARRHWQRSWIERWAVVVAGMQYLYATASAAAIGRRAVRIACGLPRPANTDRME
jgi:hypothetical protein